MRLSLIYEFIYKIDEISLKKKKSIDNSKKRTKSKQIENSEGGHGDYSDWSDAPIRKKSKKGAIVIAGEGVKKKK